MHPQINWPLKRPHAVPSNSQHETNSRAAARLGEVRICAQSCRSFHLRYRGRFPLASDLLYFEHALGGRECYKLMNADRLFCGCKAGRFGGRITSDFLHIFTRTAVPHKLPPISAQPTPPPRLVSRDAASNSPDQESCQPPVTDPIPRTSHPLLGTRAFPRGDNARVRGSALFSYNRIQESPLRSDIFALCAINCRVCCPFCPRSPGLSCIELTASSPQRHPHLQTPPRHSRDRHLVDPDCPQDGRPGLQAR
ncbi:uncharacterized protein K444DRAFT_145421 [Hyaloscypha bicolor E]|uniref:Uncharacterized protein n=1 Tax=Hyaloscypha bicolor E TaxID=1095630 RepID=A0A2J6SSQ6_9HELO|nr:uncharacterized protein K444DRAFT_145421 [Hyaloscypha bicolor E]PMD53723.1 hypothetical protein K444DRAFT_145421 [Hyaloscypha bicolor E]